MKVVRLNLDFQDCFVTPASHKELAFEGTAGKKEAWQNGFLRAVDDDIEYPVADGIPDFTEMSKRTWSGGDADRTPRMDWIQSSWKDHLQTLREHHDHAYYSFARHIAENPGLVLDIASGPGGGAMPALLFFDSKANILMTDLGVSVLSLWQKHLDSMDVGENVSFAGMDVTVLPIRSKSMDYVTDSGGFGNVDNNNVALAEAYRVLKSGGYLFLNDAITEGLDQFPDEIYKDLVSKQPHHEAGWEELVRSCGFEVLETNIWSQSRRRMKHDESDLGPLARKQDVEIYFTGFSLAAKKP